MSYEKYEVLNAMEWLGDNEKEMWDWLGDNYISSHDHSSGNECTTTLRIKTVDGEKEIMPGQILVKNANDEIRCVDEKWCKKHLIKVDNESMQ